MPSDPFVWQLHPEALTGIALLIAAFAAAGRYRPSRARLAAFVAGAALLVAVSVTPLDALSYHLLTAHLLQNVVLAEWAPALLVAGIPPALAARLPNPPPWLALPVWLAVYFAWHLPPAYDTALRHEALLHLEHATYLAAGLLVWWPVFHGRLSDGARAAYLFAAFVLAAPIGLFLALVPEPVYETYERGFAPWDVSALADQQVAGVTMAVEQAVVFFALFAFFLLRFLAEEDRARTYPWSESGTKS